MLHILLGLNGCQSIFSCPYCEGSRVNLENKPVGRGGRWVTGTMRTTANLQTNYENYMETGGDDAKKLQANKGSKFPPLEIYSPAFNNVPILKMFPLAPLHLLLGLLLTKFLHFSVYQNSFINYLCY